MQEGSRDDALLGQQGRIVSSDRASFKSVKLRQLLAADRRDDDSSQGRATTRHRKNVSTDHAKVFVRQEQQAPEVVKLVETSESANKSLALHAGHQAEGLLIQQGQSAVLTTEGLKAKLLQRFQPLLDPGCHLFARKFDPAAASEMYKLVAQYLSQSNSTGLIQARQLLQSIQHNEEALRSALQMLRQPAE